MSRYVLPLLLGVALGAAPLAAEEPLPFSMPAPDGWGTETIPFPLEFAPELPYEGLEELRFAPGMFDASAADFWTYSFVWWVAEDDPVDTSSLDRHLEAYYRGLAVAAAPMRGVELPTNPVYSTELVSTGDHSFSGEVETPDAFVTGGQIRLHVRGAVVDCPAQKVKAAIFGLSPQEPTHAVWERLDAIRTGFRCQSSAP